MKVIQLINGLGRGGGERMLWQAATGLSGVEMAVYCLTRGGPYVRQLRARGVRVHVLRHGPVLMPFACARFVRDLADCDLLHTHFFYSDLVGALLRELRLVPALVATRHETGYWMGRLHRRLERWLTQRQDLSLCVSEAVAKSLRDRGVAATKLRLLPPGVSAMERPEAAAPRPRRSWLRRIVSVGRLEPVKGHDVLLRALAELDRLSGRVRQELTLTIVGDGAARPSLEALACELGLAPRVRFTGALDAADVAAELARADLFVLPSRSEGLPLALLEALAGGLPAIATNVGGVAEVVTHEREALLVPTDSPEAMAAAIARLDDDDALAQRLAQAGRARVRREYGVERFLASLRAVYEELLLTHPRRGRRRSPQSQESPVLT